MAKVCPSCELTYTDDDFFCAADGSPLRTVGGADADNLVGSVIADRYRVEAILGEGGMGRVYRARHVRMPREAAIKVLRRAMIADPYAVAAFNREAQNAASVGDHPNVASVYDFGETADGLVFLAMEYVEGETLSRLLDREPVIAPARAVEIVRQIAAALTTAHELPEPVVHRDLKPDNILLKTTRDGTDWVKVVDFGIAKAMKRETQLLTTPGLVVGTPRYMSPEQLTGGTIDVRTDIYALALIAFQMLTGRMPFASASREDESTIQWALQRLTVAPLTLTQVRPDIAWPPAAQTALDRALAPRQEDRTPSAAEFARSLARAFGLATPASMMSAVAEAPSSGGTSRPYAGATQPVAATPPGTGASQSGVATPPAPQSPRRRPTALLAAGGVALVALVTALALWQRNPGVTSEPATDTTVPNDSVADTSRPSAPTDSQVRAPEAAPGGREPEAGPGNTGGEKQTPPPDRSRSRPPADPVRIRAELDQIRAALASPDAVASSGAGQALLRRIDRLLPTLTTGADSVEAIYDAAETNLILDRPAPACRLLERIRTTSRGTAFETNVERFLASPELDCANRR